MLISIDNVSFEYDNKPVIENLGFSTWSGNVIRIVGSNGSGKTTLLKAIAGIITPQKGKIIASVPLEEMPVAYLGHRNAIDDSKTVGENIAFWAKMQNCEELIAPSIVYYKLDYLIDEICGNLSQGQQKRVALARIMATNSKIWILDEPEINLDPEFQERLFHSIKVRAIEGGLIFIASHLKLPIENMLTVHLDYFAPNIEWIDYE